MFKTILVDPLYTPLNILFRVVAVHRESSISGGLKVATCPPPPFSPSRLSLPHSSLPTSPPSIIMAAATENKLPTDPKYDQYDFPTIAAEPQSGHPGHTSPEQDAKVHQLRLMLEQLGYKERLDTLTLLRFLRARKFDVEAAKTMYVPPRVSAGARGNAREAPPFSVLSLLMTFDPGSSTARSGARNSAQTTCPATLTTRRSRRSSSFTLNTTTRLTR